MAIINVHDAKTNLSRLLSRVAGGEEIIIARAGKLVARIVPVSAPPAKRTPDSATGLIVLKDSFTDPLPDTLLDQFEK